MPRAQAEWKWPGAVIVFSCHLISSQRWFISLEDSKLHKDKTWSVSQGHSTNPFPFSSTPSGYTIKSIALFLAQMKWKEQLINFFSTLLPFFFISFSISVIILHFEVIETFWFSIYETFFFFLFFFWTTLTGYPYKYTPLQEREPQLCKCHQSFVTLMCGFPLKKTVNWILAY